MVLPPVANLTTAVIGCGNPNRSDDGVGPRVIALLRERTLPAHVQLFDSGTDGMGVMYSARGAARLVIVDARAPDGQPGAIYEVPGAELETAHEPSLTLHDFRWDHALHAGRRIYGEGFPTDVTVFLVEAHSVALGLELSAPAEAACARVAERIVMLCREPPAS